MQHMNIMTGLELGRIMAAKILGDVGVIPVYVIDLVQGVAIEGPYARIDVRNHSIYLYTQVTASRIADTVLRNLQDAILTPKGIKGAPPLPTPSPLPPAPPIPQKQRPIDLPASSRTISMTKNTEGVYEVK
jgi:hypothetical protein